VSTIRDPQIPRFDRPYAERVVLALATVSRVEEIIDRTQASGRVPALVAGIVRGGTLAYVTGAGEHPTADRDTQFRIGSITKTFTAGLLLGLRDDGRLSLNDPLGGHLPELTGEVAAIPLRRLLSHAGGLQREPDGPWWERSAGVPPTDLIAGVTDAKLTGLPHGEFHYSNLAFALLGGVIERVAGTTWMRALTSRLLGPLGMHRTTYEPQEPYARGYVVHPWQATLREEPRHDSGAMAPAGQLWSTVEDLARWAAALAATAPLSTPTVLAPASAAEMAAPAVIADPEQWRAGYGLGLHLWRRGDRVYCGHTGSMPGYLSVLCVHRPSGTAAVAFANAYTLPGTTIGDLGVSIVEAVLEHEPPPPPPPWRPAAGPTAEVAAVCGRWWWMGREFEAAWDGAAGHLVIRGLTDADDGVWRFRAVGDDRWLGLTGENAGEILTVRRNGSGDVTELDIATLPFSRDPFPEI
jgi:CubicO group peptidase (beta-lactamase class C family)